MKKIMCLLLAVLMLAGCAAETAGTTAPAAETAPEFTGQAPVETESGVQLGGVFGLYLNGVDVTVNLPEQFVGQVMDEACMGAYSDDQLSFLTYTLSDADVEDLRAAIEQEAFEAREGGLYKSHGEGEVVEGFNTMYMIYSDSCYSIYAWKELEGCTLFLCAELEDMEMTVEELIATVVIGAE